ncbi:DsbA family protein [Paracoccus sphaerophysae]|uniref:DsbA family protein n=1 Tax=Paracoccus sphaerophysae TaxID=690417 RepID=UPI002353D516|nr:DsbA family protein [Paracoccus sphaerophysae]
MTLTLRSLVSAATLAALAGLALPAAAQTAAPAQPATQSSADQPAATPATEPAILPDLFIGAETAPVTMLEYASFTCSHCAAFHKDVFPKLKAEYIDTGKVRFAQRDVYFDEPGLWAGILARCGGDDKYYAVGSMLMDEQGTWLNAKTGDELAANLRKIGAKAGMTDAQMEACWTDQKAVESLVATFQKNAVADKIEGTPTFIVNGETVRNGPWDELKAKIDEKLAAAPAAGVAAAAAPATAPGATPAAPAPATPATGTAPAGTAPAGTAPAAPASN